MSAALTTTIEDLRETSLRELDQYSSKLWEEYGVKEIHLKEELQTWYWKTVRVKTGPHKWVEKEILQWRGMGDTLEAFIERRLDKIRNAANSFDLRKAYEKARESILFVGLYLWSMEKVPGPYNAVRLMRDADRAENMAKYLEGQGKDHIAETQRRRANLLRRKAAGEDIEIPRRASGAIDRVRAIYADLEKDNKPHARSEYINAGVAAGVHPGTCAVQYAKWKREKPNVVPEAQQEIRQTVQQVIKPPWEV